MNMKKGSSVLLMAMVILPLVWSVQSCKKDNDEEGDQSYVPTPYEIPIPETLPIMDIPSYNPTTVEGVLLGRMLYYDSLLHPMKMHACASCHLQEFGFTKPGTSVIHHVNLGYSSKFLWDAHWQGPLELAMKNEVEIFFGNTIDPPSAIANHPQYPELFRKAFGTPGVSLQRIEYAMAQFLRTMVSGNSRFDQFLRHEINLTPQEMLGFQLFNTEDGDCFHCHSVGLFTDGTVHNIGLDSIFSGANVGYYVYSNDSSDLGKFKSPSLRNVGLRDRFMHDGRFSTLEEVIMHYNVNVKLSPSLDPIMTKPGKEFGLGLSPVDVQAIKAFLLTLTDTSYTTNPAFSSPF